MYHHPSLGSSWLLAAHRLTSTMKTCKEGREVAVPYTKRHRRRSLCTSGCCLPIGVTRPGACEGMAREWGAEKVARSWGAGTGERDALSCRVMTAEMRDALSGREKKQKPDERTGKRKRSNHSPLSPRWDRASSVSCNRVERYPCYWRRGQSCSLIGNAYVVHLWKHEFTPSAFSTVLLDARILHLF